MPPRKQRLTQPKYHRNRPRGAGRFVPASHTATATFVRAARRFPARLPEAQAFRLPPGPHLRPPLPFAPRATVRNRPDLREEDIFAGLEDLDEKHNLDQAGYTQRRQVDIPIPRAETQSSTFHMLEELSDDEDVRGGVDDLFGPSNFAPVRTGPRAPMFDANRPLFEDEIKEVAARPPPTERATAARVARTAWQRDYGTEYEVGTLERNNPYSDLGNTFFKGRYDEGHGYEYEGKNYRSRLRDGLPEQEHEIKRFPNMDPGQAPVPRPPTVKQIVQNNVRFAGGRAPTLSITFRRPLNSLAAANVVTEIIRHKAELPGVRFFVWIKGYSTINRDRGHAQYLDADGSIANGAQVPRSTPGSEVIQIDSQRELHGSLSYEVQAAFRSLAQERWNKYREVLLADVRNEEDWYEDPIFNSLDEADLLDARIWLGAEVVFGFTNAAFRGT